MSFLIHSVDNENIVPWEYFPCSDALMTGEVLAFSDGKLRSALTTDLITKKPLYLSMCEKAAGEEEIPAVRIRDDMILEGMFMPAEDDEVFEGARGYIQDLALLGAEDAGAVEEIRRLIHASHLFLALADTDNEADVARKVLFEVVGVLPPDSDNPEGANIFPPKCLIRLIG